MKWPYGKKFAFTIIDDTDNGTVSNTKSVYDLLHACGIKTTKTVWVFPPRDNFTGDCLLDKSYGQFIIQLHERGFEIALHNVGSGFFTRAEIKSGIEIFYDQLGFYPTMQINHASNPDNIYWGVERYTGVLKWLMRIFYQDKRKYYGNVATSEHFWGDLTKKYIKYIRNHTFNGINTLKYDPKMPYRVLSKDEYSNYWFSSSDAHTVVEFNNMVTPKNVKRLECEGGLCIIYTHFASGFTDNKGLLDPEFKANIEFLSKSDGWFAPAGELLDYLQNKKKDHGSKFVSRSYLSRLDFLWLVERLVKKARYGK